jgi:hypothetical protein
VAGPTICDYVALNQDLYLKQALLDAVLWSMCFE